MKMTFVFAIVALSIDARSLPISVSIAWIIALKKSSRSRGSRFPVRLYVCRPLGGAWNGVCGALKFKLQTQPVFCALIQDRASSTFWVVA